MGSHGCWSAGCSGGWFDVCLMFDGLKVGLKVGLEVGLIWPYG